MKTDIKIGFSYEQLLEVIRNLPEAYKKQLFQDLFHDKLDLFLASVEAAPDLVISDQDILKEAKTARKQVNEKKNKSIIGIMSRSSARDDRLPG